MVAPEFDDIALEVARSFTNDWCLFARDVLGVTLDEEQENILRSVQVNKRTSVASGTSRGKDFISAVAAICFMYLTPEWAEDGELIGNTKVALTAPTDRQVGNIMLPEIERLWKRARKRGFDLPGRITGHDIRTDNAEWFLTGFKADDKNTEAWTGFHAVNTMFVVTEASGMPDLVYNAIEGNLQGNSRFLIVFNDNSGIGYAANTQKSPQWHKFRLDSLNAPNVLQKKIIIPGQVDWEWVNDKVSEWCSRIHEAEFKEEEGDFWWTGNDGIKLPYRPNDLFRVKVRGMAPKVSEDSLVPREWIEMAHERWKNMNVNQGMGLRLGVDVAGMGRDSSCFCHRFNNYVQKFRSIQSAGQANHMEIAGLVANELKSPQNILGPIMPKAYIDTIGEGAGVYSRLKELKYEGAVSCKYSEAAKDNKGNELHDISGQYSFVNLRAYLYWAVRDWLNPANKNNVGLPVCDELTQELTETRWKFQSNGKIIIEPKEDIAKRLGRSPDHSDSLANTFYPDVRLLPKPQKNLNNFFK